MLGSAGRLEKPGKVSDILSSSSTFCGSQKASNVFFWGGFWQAHQGSPETWCLSWPNDNPCAGWSIFSGGVEWLAVLLIYIVSHWWVSGQEICVGSGKGGRVLAKAIRWQGWTRTGADAAYRPEEPSFAENVLLLPVMLSEILWYIFLKNMISYSMHVLEMALLVYSNETGDWRREIWRLWWREGSFLLSLCDHLYEKHWSQLNLCILWREKKSAR